MSSCSKLSSGCYYNSLALKKCCLTTPLKIFPMKSFYFNFFVFAWVVFLVFVCSFVCFWYFRRGMARERGNLSKLLMCCLENGTLCPLSAVLAGIHVCSLKSYTDWQLYFQPHRLDVSFARAGLGKVLLIAAAKLVIPILSFSVLLLNSVCV